jgi:hypothetical protein
MVVADRDAPARRYILWIRLRASAILAATLAVVAVSTLLIVRYLPLYADFSYLLPQDAPAVRDLRRIEARVKSSDTVLVIVRGSSPGVVASATTDMLAGARALPPALVDRVDGDNAAARAYLRTHRHLLVSLPDLEHARDALRARIKAAKLAANPLFVDLDDKGSGADDGKHDLDELRVKRNDALAKLDRPSNVSDDGRAALLQVRTAFGGTDADRGDELLRALGAVRAKTVAAHPGVEIGFAGGVVTALSEHRALVDGTLISCIVTTVLVALVLALYFRSATLLVLLVTALVAAIAATFGIAVFTVGHLNAATAFLGSIIAGNGVNYGILLIARYLEERPRSSPDDALVTAVAATWRPTAVASLGASIAYGSLAATSFRGFADFAIIGAVGMTLCWIASFTVLPALILRFARHARVVHKEPIVGGMLAKLIGVKRPIFVVAAAGIVAVLASVVVVRYVAADPFEYDIRMLRSEGRDAQTERYWMKVSDDAFGRGLAGRTFIAADHLEDVPFIVGALRGLDQGTPPKQHVIGSVESILDVVPEHQAEKIAVLDDIRSQLDDDALDALDDRERKELAELAPPAHLTPITTLDLPATIRESLEEKDGRIGYLISIRPGDGIDELDGRDLIRFAKAIRRLDLSNGHTVTTSGASVIFADIIATVAHDGPIVTLIAAGLLVVMVVLVVGRNRRAVAVLIGTTVGSLLMVASCALFGLRVNFLDFVALPITLGLGIDYAINVAHRPGDPIEVLRTSGSAVFVCSLTTMIGYASLLFSDNLAIKGFGTASLVGEVTSVLTALVLVPAFLAAWGRFRKDLPTPG